MDFQDSIFPRITSGVEFETEIMTFLQRIGFKAYKTGGNDGGVDIIAKHTTKKREYVFYIQCKFFNKPVGKHPIQEIYAGSHYYVGNGKPVLVTNNTVTYEARMYAHRLGVEIIARPEFEVIIGLISHKLTEVINQYKGLMGMIVAVLLNDKSYYQKVVNAENTELSTRWGQTNNVFSSSRKPQAELSSFRLQGFKPIPYSGSGERKDLPDSKCKSVMEKLHLLPDRGSSFDDDLEQLGSLLDRNYR